MRPDDAGERGERARVLEAWENGGDDGVANDVGGGVLVGLEAEALADPVLDGTAATACQAAASIWM